MKADVIIIGSGLTGITLAERFVSKGRKVCIIEKRGHIGGNIYDEYNEDGILIHTYGPHIFHTSDEEVWEYLSRFTDWHLFVHKVLTYVKGQLMPMPINLDTINQFFGIHLKNEEEVRQFLENKRDKSVTKIKNSEDVIISKYGHELYEFFVKNYTKKQWDMDPSELDREVLERLPVRYNKNSAYFNDKYQGTPKEGYAKMAEQMINSKDIAILLNTDYKNVLKDLDYKRLIVTSPIDEFFDYKFGRLKYRFLDFQFETENCESYQENSVINYPNDYDFTRITEMKKLTGQSHPRTTLCKEYPSWDKGHKCYPVPSKEQKKLFERYWEESQKIENIFFAGRLGSYKYLNMDQAVRQALELFQKIA